MGRRNRTGLRAAVGLGVVTAALLAAPDTTGQGPGTATPPGGAAPGAGPQAPRPDFPPYEQVLKGYEKVVSTADGAASMYTLWADRANGEILAELPRDYAAKKYFVALTVASGETYAGLQNGDLYVYWKPYGKTLALVEVNLGNRSTGDRESKSSVQKLFTDTLLADAPILTMSPRGGPVIDLDQLLIANAPKFFGFNLRPEDMRNFMRLRTLKTAKAFPQNVEVAFEVPAQGGRLKTLHFSISEIPDNTGYAPRAADDRVGYFTTTFNDLGKYKSHETRVRYINRWHLEKADPSLQLSPPKNPIVFYIDHTTPIRYRRFVREGVLYWNQAFEKVGLVNAIEVYQQDAASGAHMDKDPEDVRYNFVRWLNNNIGTAIGPSRVHPLTGQILDADIVLTDGWIRAFDAQFNDLLPRVAVEGFGPDTLHWLDARPAWDPRYLLASPQSRETLRRSRELPVEGERSRLLGTREFDGLIGRPSQVNGLCLAASGKAFDLALLRASHELLAAESDASEESIDGVPVRFIGPLLADLVAHEVGHTLGLRHNFRASGLYSLAEINSNKIKGKKPFAASVMDYLPVNIDMKDGECQGDYAMTGVGPYDVWAIEYGYTSAKDLKPILARCVEPEHQYATDEDTAGPDPLARRYDFSANPLDYAASQMKLARHHRARLLDQFVKDGEGWDKARRGYEMTLSMQTRALGMMANWVGGAHVRRDHKGDKGNRLPVEVVPAASQRAALKWVLDNAFADDAFGLSPEVLRRLKGSHWVFDDATDFRSLTMADGTYPLHDRVMGVQASVLTMLMRPTTLRRVFDNEGYVERDRDAFTLPEMLDTLATSVWSELGKPANGKYTARQPLVSSLRRNLQRVYVERLIDLAIPDAGAVAGSKAVSNLAMSQLRSLNGKIAEALKATDGACDPYTRAHLEDVRTRITKTLDAQYIWNARDVGGAPSRPGFFFGTPEGECNHPGCRSCGRGWSDPRPPREEGRD